MTKDNLNQNDILGKDATDLASGFVGKVTAVAFYLGGHIRLEITAPSRKGRIPASGWFDFSNVEVEG